MILEKSARLAMKWMALGFAVFVLAATSVVNAEQDAAPDENMLTGFGKSFPDREDVSKSPRYHVYEWPVKDGRLVQLNAVDGEVLAAFALQEGQLEALKIGAVADRVTVTSEPGVQVSEFDGSRTQSKDGDGDGGDDGAGQCPCDGEVVYSGADVTIVMVTDQNSNIVQVATIHHQQ